MTSLWRTIWDRIAPLLSLTIALGVAVMATWETLVLLRVERPASPVMALLGDGIDEFSLQLASFSSVLRQLTDTSGVLVAIALSATTLSLIAVVAHLLCIVRSPGDLIALTVRAFDRIRLTSARHCHWGVVRDACTGHPVPLARLALSTSNGRVVARTISDTAGRYGFGIALAHMRDSAVRLEARVPGYYFPAQRTQATAMHHYHGGSLPVPIAIFTGLDVMVDPRNDIVSQGIISNRWLHLGAMAAFVTSMVTVPLAAAVSPSPLAFAILAGFAVSMLGRCAGLAHYHQT